jgi:hypothetical protein
MDKIYFLRKSLDGSHYVSGVDNDASYDIRKLAKNYPDITFVLINDEKNYGFRNVLTKSRVLEMFSVDKDLTIPCEECGDRRQYTKSCCRCGCESDVPEFLMKVLGENYTKAFCDIKMERFLKGGKSVGDSFDPITTNDLSFAKSQIADYVQKGGRMTFPCFFTEA